MPQINLTRIAVTAVTCVAMLCGLPATAAPEVSVRLPVISAIVDQDQLSIRLVRGLQSHSLAATRSVTIVAYDADGKRLAETSTVLSNRLTYAHVPLSPAMYDASRVVVSVR